MLPLIYFSIENRKMTVYATIFSRGHHSEMGMISPIPIIMESVIILSRELLLQETA
jgi:hypothetical protein